jgi:predicted HTH transcriptional regulator
VDWDEPEEYHEPEPHFDAESVEREVALVALEAAALCRRIFPPPQGSRELTVEARQALLAFALVDRYPGLTARALAPILALDREEAREVLAELMELGMLQAEPWVGYNDALATGDASYALTGRGRVVATEVALAAKRFLPGWPPPARRY